MSASCPGPTSSTPPWPWLISPMRRRMKARMMTLAHVRLGGDEAAEVGTPDPHDAARPGGLAGDEDLAVVEQVHLAGELARAVGREDVPPRRARRRRTSRSRPSAPGRSRRWPLAALERHGAVREALLGSRSRRRGRPAPRSAEGRSAPRARRGRSGRPPARERSSVRDFPPRWCGWSGSNRHSLRNRF